MKRAQATVEFTLLMTFLLFIFLATFIVIGNRMEDVNKTNEEALVREFMAMILDEINFARIVEDGYSRTFSVPRRLENVNYTLEIANSTFLVVYYKNTSYVSRPFDDNVRGNFLFNDTEPDDAFYELVIRKDYGIISVTSCPDCGYPFAVCDNAQWNGWCGFMDGLSPGFRDECSSGYDRCTSGWP